MYTDLGHFIGGTWCAARNADTAAVLSPVIEKPVGSAPSGSEDDVHMALDAVQPGLKVWSLTDAVIASPNQVRRTIAVLKPDPAGTDGFAPAASEAPFGGTGF